MESDDLIRSNSKTSNRKRKFIEELFDSSNKTDSKNESEPEQKLKKISKMTDASSQKNEKVEKFDFSVCSKQFPSEDVMQLHMKVHEDKENSIKMRNLEFVKPGGEQLLMEKPFSCSICHEGFSKLTSLGDHVESVHVLKKSSENETVPILKLFKCKYCQDIFYSSEESKSHEIQKHSLNLNKVEQDDLPRNMKVSDDSNKFKCSACDQILKSDFQLEVHYKIGNGIPMKCSKCKFKACTTRGLEIHDKKCNKFI